MTRRSQARPIQAEGRAIPFPSPASAPCPSRGSARQPATVTRSPRRRGDDRVAAGCAAGRRASIASAIKSPPGRAGSKPVANSARSAARGERVPLTWGGTTSPWPAGEDRSDFRFVRICPKWPSQAAKMPDLCDRRSHARGLKSRPEAGGSFAENPAGIGTASGTSAYRRSRAPPDCDPLSQMSRRRRAVERWRRASRPRTTRSPAASVRECSCTGDSGLRVAEEDGSTLA